MIGSRLYYSIKEQGKGILNFYYYTAQIDQNSNDLKSYVNTIDHEEVISTASDIGHLNLLYNINEIEFSKFLVEIEKQKKYIDTLAKTNPEAANIEIAKLWGPNELQRKFQEWFESNGYKMPKKD